MTTLSQWPLLLVALVLVTTGCRQKPKEIPDTQALEGLAAYNAIPTLDEQGRVVKLKLEGPLVDNQALMLVKQLTELKDLSLYGSSITDEGLLHLYEARQLEALGLGKTKVTRRGLAHIERLPALRWLWVTENTSLTPIQIENFQKKAVPGITVYQ